MRDEIINNNVGLVLVETVMACIGIEAGGPVT